MYKETPLSFPETQTPFLDHHDYTQIIFFFEYHWKYAISVKSPGFAREAIE